MRMIIGQNRLADLTWNPVVLVTVQKSSKTNMLVEVQMCIHDSSSKVTDVDFGRPKCDVEYLYPRM